MTDGVSVVRAVGSGEHADTLPVSTDLVLVSILELQAWACFLVVVNKVQFGFLYSQDFLPEGVSFLLQLD